jgi:protein-S-isoprenylcysteine O-methyltransferase Ste14
MKLFGKAESAWRFFFGKLALFLEMYLFVPLAFFYSCVKSWIVVQNAPSAFFIFNKFLTGSADITGIRFLSFYVTDFLLIFFNLTFMLGLILRKNLYRSSDSFFEILIPLVSAFSLVAFNAVNNVSKDVIFLPISAAWVALMASLGSVLVLLGVSFSFWALFALKNSFSVFIEVRDVVTAGPYSVVRHPIYAGYIIQLFGFCFVYQTFLAIGLALFAIFLFVFRAILEERKMCAFSDAYVQYQKRTPFMFPGIFFKKRLQE